MESENKRTLSKQTPIFRKYLFPITIISSMLISGSIGYAASQMVVSNNVGDAAEIYAMKKQVNEARNNSLEVIETELPKIVSDLEKYNQDLDLLVENVKWLNGNLVPIRNIIENFGTAITVVKGINTFIDLPVVGNISTNLSFAQIQLDEIDSILFSLENLTVIKQEMSDSHQKINDLVEKYQKEKSIEQLIQIEQELNLNLIYQIEDLRNITIEAHKVFELSSSVLMTINKTKSLFNSIQEMGKNTLDTIQFWKYNEDRPDIGENINESLEKDLATSKEKLQKIPNELAQRSKSSITSISNVQKELQTIKIAQMVSSE